MKTIIITFITITFCVLVIAQNRTEENSIIEKSEFIFEGEMTDFKTFKVEEAQKRYTVYKINISKVFRGSDKIENGTIEIIREGANCGISDDGEIIIMPQHGYRSTINGIYFCTASEYPTNGDIQCLKTAKEGWTTNPNMYTVPTNSFQVQVIGNIDYYTKKGIGRNFKTKVEIYNYLGKQENIVIPKNTKTEQGQLKPTPTREDSIEQIQNKLLYEERKRNYHNYMEQRMKIIDAQQKEEIKEEK